MAVGFIIILQGNFFLFVALWGGALFCVVDALRGILL